MDKLKEMITLHEGLRLSPYKCTAGKLTIGVGHNLDDKPISKEAAMMILDDDIHDCFLDLNRSLPFWTSLDEVRQAVLIDMCFNLGISRLLGFKNFLSALEEGDYERASAEMLDSRWADQVGQRAERLSEMMISGDWY